MEFFKFAVSAPRGFIFLCIVNALPPWGDPRSGSVWDINGPSWALFETQGIEALPKLIQLKFCVFYAFSSMLYVNISLKDKI